MQVLVVPDSFTGTLTAREAADAISLGWLRGAPADLVTKLAISDGGPGFVEALLTSSRYRELSFSVTDLLGRKIEISAAVTSDPVVTCYLESAQIVGTNLITDKLQRTPEKYSSYGIGEAILAAKDAGAIRIVIGLGGTAVIDGGAGMLAALGATPKDALVAGGAALNQISELDISTAKANLAGIELIVAADVDVPLLGARGAALGFGAQKGASIEQQEILETALTHFSELMPKRADGKNAAMMLGAGAAGGIGFAALALGGAKVAGFDYVASALDLVNQVAAADLIITGEGKFDWQSMQGKAISQLAQICLNSGKPLVVLAGQVDVGRREWSAIGIVGTYGCSVDGEIPANPADSLSELAVRVARTFSPNSWQN